MKILHFIDIFDFSLGGIVQFVYQQVRALAQQGQQVTLVTGRGTDLPDSWRNTNDQNLPQARELPGKLGIQGRLERKALDEVLSLAAAADLVHLHGTWILGNVQIAARLAALQKPLVISTHGMLDDWSLSHKPWKKQIFLQLFGKRYLRRAAQVHCTAEAEKEQVIKNLGFTPPITVVPPIVELPPWGAEHRTQLLDGLPGLKTNLPRIVFLSRLLPNKGPEILLSALARVKQLGHGFQMIMVGPGEPAYVAGLQQQSQQLGLAADVHWLGMQREPYKTACYRESDLYVLPTAQENFGIVLVEAMAMGLPVITTRGTDVWQELSQRGAMIAARDPEGIATAISRVLSDLERFRGQAQQAAQQVRQWLDPKVVCQQYVGMYQRIVQNSSRR